MDTVTEEDSQSPKEQKALGSHHYLAELALQSQHVKQEQMQQEQSDLIKSEEQSSSAFRRLTFQSMSMPAAFGDVAYDADIEEAAGSDAVEIDLTMATSVKAEHLQRERDHIYELFQPWALKNYGDQAKTKTITIRKKTRILKTLEGKEHSLPDSSKFRFWVKTKGFTTKRPEGFEETPGSQRRCKPLPPNTVPSDNPSEVDLFVASTQKEHGKRTYKKVAVVEEFFDIIYNVHMELGGRSGMHAGQKRTYRIITETYAFLPREAVTRFLSICPECKKNLRAVSPAASSHTEEPINESSSEVEASLVEESAETSKTIAKRRRYSSQETIFFKSQLTTQAAVEQSQVTAATSAATILPRPNSTPTQTALALASFNPIPISDQTKQSSAAVPRIRVKTSLQRPLTPPLTRTYSEPTTSTAAMTNPPEGFDMHALKTQQNLFRYYEFMRRLYSGGLVPQLADPQLQQQVQQQMQQQQRMSLPFSTHFPVSTPTIYSRGNGIADRHTTTSSDILQKMQIFPDFSKFHVTTETSLSLKRFETVEGVGDDEFKLKTKKFKTSPESAKLAKTQTQTIATTEQPHTSTPTQFSKQISAIDLCKPFLFSSNGSSPSASVSMPMPSTSSFAKATTETSLPQVVQTSQAIETPTASTIAASLEAFKAEMPSTSRAQYSAELHIPQVRTTTTSQLPPLDLERLKPITSTYLQLTRSMGLSDEDALRFDNLVSKDFKYSL